MELTGEMVSNRCVSLLVDGVTVFSGALPQGPVCFPYVELMTQGAADNVDHVACLAREGTSDGETAT